MKKIVGTFAAAVLVMPLSCGGGSDEPASTPDVGAGGSIEREARDVEEEAQELARSAGDYGELQREAFEKAMEEKLDRLEQEIAELRGQADEAGGDARAELVNAADELEEARQRASDRLRDMQEAGGQEWSAFKAELEATVGDLERRYERALETR